MPSLLFFLIGAVLERIAPLLQAHRHSAATVQYSGEFFLLLFSHASLHLLSSNLSGLNFL
jgi:hypothetical protein